MRKINEKGSNLEIGADIMAVTLFIFIIMTIVMEPIEDRVEDVEGQSEVKSLQDMDLAESESGTAEMNDEDKIELFIYGDRFEIRRDGGTMRLPDFPEFESYVSNLHSTENVRFTIYAQRDISFQNVVNAVDVIKNNNPQAVVNIGVTTK